ncbi:LPP20 family lipoprotein [Psychromonas hadalis]|uniref:LPP20 family lipoprotein n=1 Tax=Psychromonas hadalis TaxID=211669 RepID=UPI0003B71FD7|nr:LPP20 family lipoprotein [Psychromonas hadalis]
MNLKRNIITLFSCFLMVACASTTDTEKRPVWIDNANSVYADTDYLTAVGQASKRNRASKNATANLAEIFYVNVQAETKILTEATKQESALGVSMESSTSLQRSIQTDTEQAISGVKIKESWLSPSGEYYTLAVLEKRQAAMSLNEIIMDLDNSTAELIDYSINTAPNSIASLNALRAARDEQMARHMANLQLKQVSVSGVPIEISSKKIERLIAKKLASMEVSVDIEHKKHTKTVQSGLAQLGVKVVANANIVVSAEIDITEPTLIKGWYWLRGSYELSLSENGQVISRKRWPLKVSAKQEEMLMLRLQDRVNANITQYLTELVSDSPTL